MKKIGLFIISCMLVLSFVACSKEETKETMTKVRVAEVTHSLFYAPFYVALGKDFFKKQGLDVEVTTTPGGDKTMTTLLSGGADIALVGSETSIYVYKQNANDPIFNFAQLTQTDGTFLVARKNVANFNWNDLKGVTFLGQRKGGMPQMVGEYVLKKHGINPQKDLNLIQNVDFANIATAFSSGTGEYVQLFEPTASIFEKEGKGTIVASFGKESGKVPYTAFMTKESYLKENKKVVTAFTKGLYEAQKWVDTSSAEEIAKVVKPFFDGVDDDIMVRVIERYKAQDSFATNPILDQEEWNNLLGIMKEAGVLNGEAPYDKLVNTEIANEALK
ncbi:MAG: ABC transporter substrate-binding protein [Bacillaceae bacterium]